MWESSLFDLNRRCGILPWFVLPVAAIINSTSIVLLATALPVTAVGGEQPVPIKFYPTSHGCPHRPLSAQSFSGCGDAPFTQTGSITPPVAIKKVRPLYPELAKRARIQGMLILEAVICKSGEIGEIRIIRSAHPLLDRAAVEAVSLWKYRPALMGGRPISVYLVVTVHFCI